MIESFAQAMPMRWMRTPQVWMGRFRTPEGRPFDIIIQKEAEGDDAWSFHFADTTSKEQSSNLTGKGEVFTIFATIFQALRDFLTEKQPQSVAMKGKEARQQRFYETMMAKHVAEITASGYRQEGSSLIKVKETQGEGSF